MNFKKWWQDFETKVIPLYPWYVRIQAKRIKTFCDYFYSRGYYDKERGEMETIHLINVPHYGWLCTAFYDGRETYRGEYRQSYYIALEYYEVWKEERADD